MVVELTLSMFELTETWDEASTTMEEKVKVREGGVSVSLPVSGIPGPHFHFSIPCRGRWSRPASQRGALGAS